MKEYLRLVQLGSSSRGNPPAIDGLRLAILGDHSTQQLVNVVKGVFLEQSCALNTYEGEFDSAALEIFNPNSALYAFKPEYVYLSISAQKYRERFYAADEVARADLPAQFLSELRTQIEALSSRGIQVIVNTLALPVERLFGNYSATTPFSPYGSICRVNSALIEMVGSLPGLYLNDIAYLASQIGGRHFFDNKLWSLNKYFCANKYLPEIARSLYATIGATRGRITKCIVLDLDNTLWGGVIGDDGIEGICLSDTGAGEAYLGFQKYLLALKDRGYVLAVCSKNEEAVARAPFCKHPNMALREKDISIFVANWNDKASNIEFIAQTLNLGLDSIIFLDDSAFERGQVRNQLPQVIVPEMPDDVSDFIPFLEQMQVFETTTFSAEDRKRAEKYAQEATRGAEQSKYRNIDDYLKSLEMKMNCERFNQRNLPRIAQLIQRSNQFNLRTQRYSLQQCEAFAQDSDRFLPLSFSVRDKFGDYGLIGVVCSEYGTDFLEIHEFVMSCRVLKRGVEQYVFNSLVRECQNRGISEIRAEFIPTQKNSLVRELYDSFGFQRVKEHSDGRVSYSLSVDSFRQGITYFEETVGEA